MIYFPSIVKYGFWIGAVLEAIIVQTSMLKTIQFMLMGKPNLSAIVVFWMKETLLAAVAGGITWGLNALVLRFAIRLVINEDNSVGRPTAESKKD